METPNPPGAAAAREGADADEDAPWPGPVPPGAFRVATFNVSLFRDAPGALASELEGESPHAAAAAELIQRIDPDIILLNEVDHDPEGRAVTLLVERYLAKPQAPGLPALEYRSRFAPPSNTGAPSGRDLDRDGTVDGPGDRLGYGDFEGQYAFVLLSRHPVRGDVRCFGKLLWRDMPQARLPDDPATPEVVGDWYDAETLEVLRLSSKNHCDVPLAVPSGDDRPHRLHLLVSHPTPPVFDGPEDRNGRRNHDEIRFWAEYIRGASWPVDDRGIRGGLGPRASFVIAGDLNADPIDGAAGGAAIAQLLQHARVVDPAPRSLGGELAASLQAGANRAHFGDPRRDTADFPDDEGGPGNLRVDYVLPSADLEVVRAGVGWPADNSRSEELLRFFDHRPVWVDLRVGSTP